MDDIVSIPEFEGFEWDEANAQKNWQNHGVSPSEAEQVFFRKPLLAVEDIEHSQEEQRYRAIHLTQPPTTSGV